MLVIIYFHSNIYFYEKQFINLYIGMDEFNDPTLPLEKALEDTARIDYHFDHLYYLQTAIKYVPSNKKRQLLFF